MKSRFVLTVVPSMENAYHNLKDFVAVFPPIGLISIAAVVELNGYDVVIVDGDAELLTIEQTVQKIALLAPDYVGATIMTATMDISCRFFHELKKVIPKVKVIVGGPHVSALPERTLMDSLDIDIAVIGEGDETIIALLNAYESNSDLEAVSGISFRKNGTVITNAPRGPVHKMELLPIPAFHLLDKAKYKSYKWNMWSGKYRSPLGVIFTGRGCVGKCNFCAAHTVFGRGVRYFSIEQITSQIEYLVNEWGIKVLYFQDDTFTANKKLVNQICDYIIEKKYNENIEIMVSSRVDTVHFPTLEKMKRAGVRWICFGVESGNQEMLNKMGKKITVDQIKKAYKLSRDAGLFIAGNFMIGHIGETESTAEDTIKLACDLDQEYASIAIAIPLPGTDLYAYCIDNGISLPCWNDFGSVNTPPIPLNINLDGNKLNELRNIAIRKFFFRPLYLLRILYRLNGITVLYDFAKTYIALLKEKYENRF